MFFFIFSFILYYNINMYLVVMYTLAIYVLYHTWFLLLWTTPPISKSWLSPCQQARSKHYPDHHVTRSILMATHPRRCPCSSHLLLPALFASILLKSPACFPPASSSKQAGRQEHADGPPMVVPYLERGSKKQLGRGCVQHGGSTCQRNVLDKYGRILRYIWNFGW